jgi:hypothetical protein
MVDHTKARARTPLQGCVALSLRCRPCRSHYSRTSRMCATACARCSWTDWTCWPRPMCTGSGCATSSRAASIRFAGQSPAALRAG